MGSMRAFYLSQELAQHFQYTHVLSSDNAFRLEQESLPIHSKIIVDYLPTYDYRTITSKRSKNSHYSEESKSTFLGKSAVKILNSFPYSSYIGEGGYKYRKTSFKKAVEIIKEKNISHIFSSFRPYADHEIASSLKKQFPQLIWIADYRDIHVDDLKKNVFHKGHQFRKSKRLLKDADLVTTISKGCLDHLKHLGKDHMVLYNGLPKKEQEPKVDFSHQKLQITFTGSLYGDSRDPSPLLKSLSTLIENKEIDPRRININYAGKDTRKWKSWIHKYNLDDSSTIHGMLTYRDSLNLQAISHINLLLTFSHPKVLGAITGKMLEYLASRKLILCLINGVKDQEIEDFMSRYSHGSTFYNGTENLNELQSFIKNAYLAMLSRNDDHFYHNRPIHELSWPFLASSLLKKINKTNSI